MYKMICVDIVQTYNNEAEQMAEKWVVAFLHSQTVQ